MKKIPFRMIVDTPMEKYRHKTWKTKEPETIAWIKSFKNGDSFIDIGANIGIYTLFCASYHSKSKIWAYEPHNLNFFRLLDNIRLNGYGDRISANRFMIGEKTCHKKFIKNSNEIGSSGGQMKESSKPHDVPCYAIDDLNIYGFDFPTPNHIKIDIDGQELKVIQGMKETIKTTKLKSMLIEINNDCSEIKSIMEQNGFSDKNKFNRMKRHSRIRRKREDINAENVIFTR